VEEEERYTPAVTTPKLAAIVRTPTMMGKNNGKPMVRMPRRMGRRTTDKAASGTVGTRNIFPALATAGYCLGRNEVMEPNAAEDVDDMESIAENHVWESDIMALISGRNGPVRQSFKRSVGPCSSLSEGGCFNFKDVAVAVAVPVLDSGSKCKMSHLGSLM
jgi:hypothetical protein